MLGLCFAGQLLTQVNLQICNEFAIVQASRRAKYTFVSDSDSCLKAIIIYSIDKPHDKIATFVFTDESFNVSISGFGCRVVTSNTHTHTLRRTIVLP